MERYFMPRFIIDDDFGRYSLMQLHALKSMAASILRTTRSQAPVNLPE